MYTRFQAIDVDPDLGIRVGIFGLVNRLGRRGLLTPSEEEYRQSKNAWYDAAYQDPSLIDPLVYDRSVHPHATAWFKTDAASHLLAEVQGYLDILANHDVPIQRTVTDAPPGRVIYEDNVQMIVVPA